MTDTRYLYSVHPHKPIVLPNTAPIRCPKSLYLTLDEVMVCLKRGAVYRRFADIGVNERVTILNAERMHNEKFMTEEEYAQFLEDNVAYKRGTVSSDKKEEAAAEEVKVEEVKEETAPTEKVKEEEPEQKVEETVEEKTETTETEAAAEEVKTEETSTEETKTEEVDNQTKNNNNKKRHR